jgi:hypothetical protein
VTRSSWRLYRRTPDGDQMLAIAVTLAAMAAVTVAVVGLLTLGVHA